MNTGLDPELLTLTGNNYLVPASLFLPAPERDKRGVLNPLSYDNAAAEFRPVHGKTVNKLVNRLSDLLTRGQNKLKNARRDGRVPASSAMSLVPCGLLADHHRRLPSVMNFGCSPSWRLDDDYMSHEVRPHVSALDTPLRSAGFHIHTEIHDSNSQMIVAVMDGLLGLTDVILSHQLGFFSESRARRLTLGYGMAGEYRTRLTSNGMTEILEYRTLSPWPLVSPDTTVRVLHTARAIASQPIPVLMGILGSYPLRSDVAKAVNECDLAAAEALLPECRLAWRNNTGGAGGNLESIMDYIRDSIRVNTGITFARSWR